MRRYLKIGVLLIGLAGLSGCSVDSNSEVAVETAPIARQMTPTRMAELVKSFDENAKIDPSGIAFTLAEREVIIIHDEPRDRMRIISPIAPSRVLNGEMLMRMSQANFDAVLDVRYAVADSVVWATFIHPLGSLQQEEFMSAIAQVVTAAETFGSTYTSGAMVFGGGDSSALHDELLKELDKAAKTIGDPI